jgi:hypothetical protein
MGSSLHMYSFIAISFLANQIATNLQVIFFTFVLFWKTKISSACIAPHKGYERKEFEGYSFTTELLKVKH